MAVIEVDMSVGFWHGKGTSKRFYSKDIKGVPVTLTKSQYDDMLIAGEVIVIDEAVQ